MFLSIVGLLAMVGFSLGSTFISVQKAGAFFNSAPMVVFWAGLVVMLTASVVLWACIRRSPGLLLLHVGCILIIVGAMWGSGQRHELRARYFDDPHVYFAETVLSPGESANIGFEIKLEKAWTEYYPAAGPPWEFYYELRNSDGDAIEIPLKWENEAKKPMGKFSVTGEDFHGEILKMSVDDEVAFSGDEHFGRAVPPMVVMEISRGDKSFVGMLEGRDDTDVTRMSLVSLYDSQADWEKAHSPALVMYNTQPVRDYKAVLSIHDGGTEVMRNTIEKNYPLHYGGYHFYLAECDSRGRFVEITARSDAGLYVVYAGMISLCIGVFWIMWVAGIVKWLRQKQTNGSVAN